MRSNLTAAIVILASCGLWATITSAQPANAVQSGWTKQVEIDPTGITTEKVFRDALAKQGLKEAGYVNWYTGRWPYISFIGGMAMGNHSEDLTFFYQKPFRWWTEVLDYVMQDGGDIYGIRATIHGYKSKPAAHCSYLLLMRTDTLLRQYHPSYIYANGRKIWDFKKHPMQDGKLLVPFSIENAVDPVIDFIVDKTYTPDTKGLAFRMFFVTHLGEPGVKVDLAGAEETASRSPADSLEKFQFGVFPSGYEFWTDQGMSIAEIMKTWKPNFRPDYPVDEVFLCPNMQDQPGRGSYHDFMVTYGGCNLMANGPDPELARKNASYLRGALADIRDSKTARSVLAMAPSFKAVWFTGEGNNSPSNVAVVAAAKQATGAPERCISVHEPFPPTLASAHEYESGTDMLILKNEEDPQYNILMSMSRGAGHSFGKPFGFYWEQTHYPYPSLDGKLHCVLLYYLSGGSWIGAEAENAPSFSNGIVAEWVMPYVKAMRFAMVHPARGRSIVPIGIVWGKGDKWTVPYNPFGEMDTFMRHLDYDHATRTLSYEPAFTHPFPWMPRDRSKWTFQTAGHLGWFIDSVPEIRGYDLLDVFFPKYGDACTATLTHLMTGTPYGPVDFVYGDAASTDTLKSYGMLAFLGHATINAAIEQKLQRSLTAGVPVLFGAQHIRSGDGGGALGLTLVSGSARDAKGPISGIADLYATGQGSFDGKVWIAKGDGWQTIASVGDRPLVVGKTIGGATAYVYLGELIHQGGDALRPILESMGKRARLLNFTPGDDQIEYVAYQKGVGAWVAVFNHGNIVIGCDRLKEPRIKLPFPLASKPKGPWNGQIEFRLDKLGLDPKGQFALYEVEGIDGDAFEQLVTGQSGFEVREIASDTREGIIRGHVTINKRAQYVIAPKGEGAAVFFGKP